MKGSNMKKLSIIFLICLSLFVVIAFSSCGDDEPSAEPNTEPQLSEISGISFNGVSVTYDGTEKEIEISGTVPEGVSVSYSNNVATNAGVYDAVATLSGEGYKTLTLNAKLTINKANIEGVSLSDATFTYDGAEKEVLIEGNLPSGVTVAYVNSKATDAGEYSVTATISGANYETLVLNSSLLIKKAELVGIYADLEQSVYVDGNMHLPTYAGSLPSGVSVTYMVEDEEKPNGISTPGTHEFKIIFSSKNYQTLEIPVTYKIKINAIELAGKVISSFGTSPDPWSLLPQAFSAQHHTVSNVPTYDDFLSVKNIPTNVIGKQMNVAYGVLNKTTAALNYVNIVTNALNGIKTLYTTYLDSNPADYQNYTASIAGFTFTLMLDQDSYLLRASIGPVVVEIFSNVSESTYGARVQLTETTVLKYTVSPDDLMIAMDILDMSTTQISFARNDNGYMVGVLYEYLVVADKQITATSAMIEVGEKYTTVIGTKGDFVPTSVSRNCEIYDNETGALVGTEVREDVSGTVFNTYWFQICNLGGVNSIMKIDELNGDNADTIYINGITSDTLHTKLMGISFGSKMLSRRYDIEFKTVYAYTYNAETEEYEAVKFEIPMIFIQEEVISTFVKDFEDKNEDTLNGAHVSLLIKDEDFEAISRAYQDFLPVYDALKDAVTHEAISNYCKS